MKWCDVLVGTGTVAKPGESLLFKYVGRLEEGGTAFDSSVGAEFEVGTGAVIRGWDEGVLGNGLEGSLPAMQAGGKRRLVIPPHLGYGARGAGNGIIPPDSTLFFGEERRSKK